MTIVPIDPPTIANATLYVLLVGLKRLQERLNNNAALKITLNDEAHSSIPSSQYGFYLNWCVAEWHNTGGHICLTNGDRGNPMTIVPIDPPTIANAPLYVLLVGLKRLQERLNNNAALK